MLPVIAAVFGTENIQKRGNVLFDSATQIHKGTADCLGLKGKDMSLSAQ
jgi:hypothetical protein